MTRLIPARPHSPIHLYRHLLREASYLPPACRPYVAGRIKARFRNHRHDAEPKSRLRQANHDLRFLRAANAGDMARMSKILLASFGRLGARRRELMAQLRTPEPPANSAELDGQISRASRPRDWLDKWDTEKLLAMARSQGQQNVGGALRPPIKTKTLDPSEAVPELNIWGRPFHEKVARTKQKKWWVRLAHRIMPPVARGEWELLRDLAAGTKGKEWDMPPRRPVGVPAAGARGDAPGSWDWAAYLTAPVSTVERPRARMMRLLNGIEIDDGAATGAHAYTPRWWRRRYREIWQLTATMTKHEKPGNPAKAWEVRWGTPQLHPVQAGPAHQEFFEGVDGNGKVPRTSQPRQVDAKAQRDAADGGASRGPRDKTDATTPPP